MNYLVVDGFALAHRAWHAYPDWKNDAGREVKVTVGFFKQLLSRVRGFEGHQLVFVFDSAVPCFRKSLDASYKGTRDKKPDSFYAQIDEIIKLCKMIGPTYVSDGYEADDLAGSFVSQFVGPEDTAVLLTVDGDWLQLLRTGVEVIQLKTVGPPVRWTKELFFEKNSGLTPMQLIDVKAITGDGSDNIPGIPGIGWVTVNKLLKEYKTVEEIYANILKIPNKGNVQTKLIDAKDRVFLNKELATIKTDVALDPPFTITQADEFLDYLVTELNAESLANLFGVYVQMHKEAVA